MFSLALLICLLQALNFVQSLPSHNLHEQPHHLIHRQAKSPNDLTTLGAQVIPTPLNEPKNIGSVNPALETKGITSVVPFVTNVPVPQKGNPYVQALLAPQVAQPTPQAVVNGIFDNPIDTTRPPNTIGTKNDHPQPKTGIVGQTNPIGTNKFYAGFFLGAQTNPVWTHPYSLQWSKGTGNANSWGISIAHTTPEERIFGPDAAANPVQYYINPIGVQSLIYSAKELGPSMQLTTDTLTAFSANLNLLTQSGANPAITIPLVQGMGFITAAYKGVTPYIESSVSFSSVTPLPSPKTGVAKYKIQLANGKTWLLYAIANDGSGLILKLTSSTRLAATVAFSGYIQIAKNVGNTATNENSFDRCAGSYATAATINGDVNGASGSYTISWKKSGNGSPLLMMALPHHIESLDSTTAAGKTTIQLQTTTKGIATGIVGDSWRLVEPDMPTTMGFAPWDVATKATKTLSQSAKDAINAAAQNELAQDINAQTDLNSMYFSGKAFSKFATAIYATRDLAGNVNLANSALTRLKAAFEKFATNKQTYPLTYDTKWGGVVSTAAFSTGDPGADFGNSYYNDHHFHWAYFIHTAAIIGYLDPSWLATHKAWVNTLVRDAANPSTKDTYFPQSRAFDWYHGHSWAKGLFDSADSKDEESSSEDTLFAYAMKTWGYTISDPAMEARGNLQLAILRRSLRNYFLLESNNANHPANFIKNKVSGILFENKVDHTTYFGTKIEYIQGIHMLPLLPFSTYTRGKNFVQEEWNTFFSNGRVDQTEGGWRGILYSNLAIIDPKTSYNWFNQANFNPVYIDGGASRTWYLAFAAGLGGAA